MLNGSEWLGPRFTVWVKLLVTGAAQFMENLPLQ